MKQRSGKRKARPDPISLTGEVLDTFGRGMIHLDPNMNLTYANRTASRLLGKQQAGLALQNILSGPLGRTFLEASLRALKEKIIVNFEGYYPEPLDIWLKVHCLPQEHGIITVLEDITSELKQLENHARNKALLGESKEISAQGISQEREDVGGLKLAQTALRESREKLRIAQQAGKVGIFDWDMVTNTISLSDELKAMYGVTPDFIGSLDNWAKITPPEDIRSLLEKLQQTVAQHKKEEEGEYRIIYPDGEVRWMLSRGFISYEGHRPIRIIGTAIDITELKSSRDLLSRVNEELEQKVQAHTGALSRTVAKLNEQRELLQAIIDNIPVIITLWKPDLELIMVNREFERIGGWPREEALNMDILTPSFPDPAYRQEIIRKVRTAQSTWGDLVWTTRSGRKLDILWSAIGLSDGSRLGIGIDITQRKKMEKNLLHLATAVEQAGEGFVLFNADWVIEYVNPAYEHLTGYTKEELIGKGEDILISSVIGDVDPELPHRAVCQGEIWRSHIKVLTKSGDIIDVHLTLSPVRDNTGEFIKYVSIVKDISQEVRHQQATAQSQKMEAIGTLAGGIAHDLKNIFTPILINSETAVEEVGKGDPVCPLLEEILQAARTGMDLVEHITTFSRMKSVEKVPVDITSLVSEILTLLRAAVSKTIEIRTRINTDNAVVNANPTQIKQVLINLGSNAAYAMKGQRGLLEMGVACVELDKDIASMISPDLSSGPHIEVAVRDTGQGIDEETLQHIFDPFFTTKQGEGTGMGLTVVQWIVKDHKGAVSVWSRPGKGSIFKVLLPKLEKEPSAEIQEH